MNRRAAPLVALGTCCLLAACGFQLRGTQPATTIESVYVVANESLPMAAELERAILRSGVGLPADRANAKLTVTVLSDRSRRQTISVTPQVRTAELEISRQVSYRVESAAGDVLLDDRTVAGSRTYRVDSGNLVGSDQQASLLETELGQDLVAQILRSLEAASRR